MNAGRKQIPLSEHWTFRKTRVPIHDLPFLEDLPSAQVSLPHTWNIHDSYVEDIRYYRGWGSYARGVDLPADTSGGRWHLVTDGFYGTGDLSINGHYLDAIDGQFLGIDRDISSSLRAGRNHIGIRLTNRCASHILPGIDMPDFILYGGLSARVRLEYRPPIHLEPLSWMLHDHGVLTDDPLLFLRGTIVNSTPGLRQITLTSRLHDLTSGALVAEKSTTATSTPGASGITHDLNPGRLELWSPENPTLYSLSVELWMDGICVDQHERRVGFRQALFQPASGFFLNGRRYPLRGVNRHEEIPGFGRAIPSALHVEDVKTIREMGCNFVRLSHYPQSPDFLNACDSGGLLVFPEIASWKSVRKGRWLNSAKKQMTALIQRDRHHPSVILWGMGNEGRSRVAYQSLSEIVRHEDPIRPTIYAENHLYRARREKTIGIPHIWGLNYELDCIPEALESGTLKNVIVSECSNHPQTARGNLDLELIQLQGVAEDIGRLDGIPGIAGYCLWSFADYATLRKNRFRRFSGMVDAWRSPKLAFYYLQARNTSTPVLYATGLLSLRDNSPSRTLIIITNGRPLHVRLLQSERIHAHSDLRMVTRHCWVMTIPFVNESLNVVAAFENQERVFTLHPWNVPYTLQAQLRSLPHDGTGWLAQVDIQVVDQAGQTCKDWEGLATLILPPSCQVHTCFDDTNVAIAAGTGRSFISGGYGLANPYLQVTARPDLKSPRLPLPQPC
jgi:beta-galactosidase